MPDENGLLYNENRLLYDKNRLLYDKNSLLYDENGLLDQEECSKYITFVLNQTFLGLALAVPLPVPRPTGWGPMTGGCGHICTVLSKSKCLQTFRNDQSVDVWPTLTNRRYSYRVSTIF